jgi:hypothetical protein
MNLAEKVAQMNLAEKVANDWVRDNGPTIKMIEETIEHQGKKMKEDRAIRGLLGDFKIRTRLWIARDGENHEDTMREMKKLLHRAGEVLNGNLLRL